MQPPMDYGPMPMGMPMEQVIGKQYETNTGMMQAGNDDLIRWMESPQLRVDSYVRELAGQTFNVETGEYEWSKHSYKVMNEAGISFWKGVAKSIITTDMVLSNFEDDAQIQKIAEPTIARAVITCNLKKEVFGMDAMDISLVREQVSNLCIGALRRGLKGGEKKFLNFTTSHEIKAVQQEPQKQPFFFGGLFNKKR